MHQKCYFNCNVHVKGTSKIDEIWVLCFCKCKLINSKILKVTFTVMLASKAFDYTNSVPVQYKYHWFFIWGSTCIVKFEELWLMEKENLYSLPIVLVFSLLYSIFSLGKSIILIQNIWLALHLNIESWCLLKINSTRMDKNVFCYLA